MKCTQQPRFIRLKDAPTYLGMDKNRFKTEVRPYLVEIPIGKQGIAFDRLDLDAWVEHYKACNGRPSKLRRKEIWDAKEHQGSINVKGPGISTNKSVDAAFAKALELTISKKQSAT